MSGIDWSTSINYANLIRIAESVGPKDDYDSETKERIQKAGYRFLQQLFGDDLATDVNPHAGEIVSFGFLAVSPARELVAVIRGTDTISEWIHDAAFLMVPCPVVGAHGFTEDGFTAIYRSLRVGKPNDAAAASRSIGGYLDNGTAASVTICGHSLGGALATLLTLDIALNSSCHTPTTFTYASPRVGDHLFSGAYNAMVSHSYRITNRQDLVPTLPPALPLPYEHVDTYFELNPPTESIEGTIACMHHLTTYLWLMSQRTGTTGYPLDEDCIPKTS